MRDGCRVLLLWACIACVKCARGIGGGTRLRIGVWGLAFLLLASCTDNAAMCSLTIYMLCCLGKIFYYILLIGYHLLDVFADWTNYSDLFVEKTVPEVLSITNSTVVKSLCGPVVLPVLCSACSWWWPCTEITSSITGIVWNMQITDHL